MQFVNTRAGLEAAAGALSGAARLFFDTEFESQGRTLLCLLQISSGDEVFVVDPLELGALDPLAAIVTGTDVEWVVHAGAQDVNLLVRRFGLRTPPRVFDTQVAWALSGPEYSVSLAYLKYRLLGVRSGKPHQADDWKRRPLPASQIAYAASDVEDLPALHDNLRQRVAELHRGGLVFDASRELVWPDPEPPAGVSLGTFRNAWQLDHRSQAALRFIIEWYNRLDPRERSYAPEPKTLLAIASRLPKTRAELARIKGVPQRWCREHGESLTRQLVRRAAEAEGHDFMPLDPPPYATFDEIRLDAWLQTARAELCTELSIAPELAFPGRLLRRMRAAIQKEGDQARGADALVGWRRTLLAEPYLAYAGRHPAPA